MYNRLLEELYDLSLLFDLAEDVSPRFAFVEKVVIPCITTSIRTNLGRTIFSAGRPDELHKVSLELYEADSRTTLPHPTSSRASNHSPLPPRSSLRSGPVPTWRLCIVNGNYLSTSS